jgi:hypothetical protein
VIEHVRRTVLFRQLSTQCRNIRVHALRLLLCKRAQVVPVALQRIRNVVRRLGVSQLQNGIVVERPVLCLFVFAPEFLALDAKDLHPDATWGWRVVGHDFGRERRVAHDYVVGSWLLEHALSEVLREVVVDREFAHYALHRVLRVLVFGDSWTTYALGFQMGSSEAVHVFVEIHHLKAVELVGHFLDLFLLAWLDGFDAWSIPFYIGAGSFLVLSTGFDGPAGDFAIVNVLNPMVADGAGHNLCAVHLGVLVLWCER